MTTTWTIPATLPVGWRWLPWKATPEATEEIKEAACFFLDKLLRARISPCEDAEILTYEPTFDGGIHCNANWRVRRSLIWLDPGEIAIAEYAG